MGVVWKRKKKRKQPCSNQQQTQPSPAASSCAQAASPIRPSKRRAHLQSHSHQTQQSSVARSTVGPTARSQQPRTQLSLRPTSQPPFRQLFRANAFSTCHPDPACQPAASAPPPRQHTPPDTSLSDPTRSRRSSPMPARFPRRCTHIGPTRPAQRPLPPLTHGPRRGLPPPARAHPASDTLAPRVSPFPRSLAYPARTRPLPRRLDPTWQAAARRVPRPCQWPPQASLLSARTRRRVTRSPSA